MDDSGTVIEGLICIKDLNVSFEETHPLAEEEEQFQIQHLNDVQIYPQLQSPRTRLKSRVK